MRKRKKTLVSINLGFAGGIAGYPLLFLDFDGLEILGLLHPDTPLEGHDIVLDDDQFGPIVMFGSGGVEVEGLVDVDFALAPLSSWEAEALIDGTWAGRKLHGFRHLPPADRRATVETVLRLAQLADDFPQLSEIEINPLRVLPDKQGAFALDVRMRVMAPNENYTM